MLISSIVKLNPIFCLKTMFRQKKRYKQKSLCIYLKNKELVKIRVKTKGKCKQRNWCHGSTGPLCQTKPSVFVAPRQKNKSLFAFCAQLQKTKAFIYSTFLASPCLECLLHKAKLWIGNIYVHCVGNTYIFAHIDDKYK